MWNDIVKANCARANTTASQPSNIAPIHRSSIWRGAYHAGCGDCTRVRRGTGSLPSAVGVQQPRHGTVDLLVLAFAVVLEHDLALLVDDVLRRPIQVAVGVPGLGV